MNRVPKQGRTLPTTDFNTFICFLLVQRASRIRSPTVFSSIRWNKDMYAENRPSNIWGGTSISAGPPLGGATRLRRDFYSQTVKQLPFLVLLSTYQSVVSLTVIFSDSWKVVSRAPNQQITLHFGRYLDPWIPVKQCSRPGGSIVLPGSRDRDNHPSALGGGFGLSGPY